MLRRVSATNVATTTRNVAVASNRLMSSSSLVHTSSKFASAAVLSTLSSARHFNSTSSSDAAKEAELEREARARAELEKKYPGASGQSFFSGQKPQPSPGATGSGTVGGFNPAWANTNNHKLGRFFATVVVSIAMYIMFKRIGIFGDYSHLSLPYFAASPADSAKWIIFMFNVEDRRRRQLQAQWETQRAQFPAHYNFFDFVDQQEQYWRSSPTNSAEQVAALIGNMVLTQGAPRTIANVKGTLGGSNPISAFTGGSMATAEERATRIDNMVAGQAMLNAGFGGVLSSAGAPSLPPAFVISPQQQHHQQSPQIVGGPWPPQQHNINTLHHQSAPIFYQPPQPSYSSAWGYPQQPYIQPVQPQQQLPSDDAAAVAAADASVSGGTSAAVHGSAPFDPVSGNRA